MGQWCILWGFGALAHMGSHLLLPPYLSWSGSWPPTTPSHPKTLGPAQPTPACLLPGQGLAHVRVSSPPVSHHCPPALGGGAWMQVQVVLRRGNHHPITPDIFSKVTAAPSLLKAGRASESAGGGGGSGLLRCAVRRED